MLSNRVMPTAIQRWTTSAAMLTSILFRAQASAKDRLMPSYEQALIKAGRVRRSYNKCYNIVRNRVQKRRGTYGWETHRCGDRNKSGGKHLCSKCRTKKRTDGDDDIYEQIKQAKARARKREQELAAEMAEMERFEAEAEQRELAMGLAGTGMKRYAHPLDRWEKERRAFGSAPAGPGRGRTESNTTIYSYYSDCRFDEVEESDDTKRYTEMQGRVGRGMWPDWKPRTNHVIVVKDRVYVLVRFESGVSIYRDEYGKEWEYLSDDLHYMPGLKPLVSGHTTPCDSPAGPAQDDDTSTYISEFLDAEEGDICTEISWNPIDVPEPKVFHDSAPIRNRTHRAHSEAVPIGDASEQKRGEDYSDIPEYIN